jgi:hypothetical protein
LAIAVVFGAAMAASGGGCGSSIKPGGQADGAAMKPDVTAPTFGGDSDGGDSAAGAGCTDIQASNYDLSCASDTDCVVVGGFGNPCIVCLNCAGAAINKASEGQYWIDQRKATAGLVPCVCPTYPSSCCVRGVCRVGDMCESPTGLANIDADIAVADAASDEAGADSGTIDAADASAE